MKTYLLAAGLTLATATGAYAQSGQSATAMADDLSGVPATISTTFNDCVATESSSRAIRACSKLIRASGASEDVRAQLYTRRALHKMALGRFDSASDDFSRAGDLSGDTGLASLGQGFAAIDDNNLSSARASFRDDSTEGRTAVLAEYGLGLTYQMEGKDADARAAYERALAINPEWRVPSERLETLDRN
ncbi:tetratricopeptide repeat protein [uncultured Algimonas sp.]|uniref:tetratricopeptide repeat protein n=1 Tax=uncultured Algimonas sp. TaxID=1547920 RepID=UPI0026157535|nr:tetratricopeptide repeat protein [uncultured Algimonas sp.]